MGRPRPWAHRSRASWHHDSAWSATLLQCSTCLVSHRISPGGDVTERHIGAASPPGFVTSRRCRPRRRYLATWSPGSTHATTTTKSAGSSVPSVRPPSTCPCHVLGHCHTRANINALIAMEPSLTGRICSPSTEANAGCGSTRAPHPHRDRADWQPPLADEIRYLKRRTKNEPRLRCA